MSAPTGKNPGKSRATLKAVATAAGVGVTTAADILRGETTTVARYNPETVGRVRKAAERLAYRPNRMAAALVSGRSRMVTLLSERAYEPYFARVARHVEACVRADGYEMVVVDVANLDAAKHPGIWPADGILAVEGEAWRETVLRLRPSDRTPLVSLGTCGIEGFDRVLLDVPGAMTTATEHLVAKGCRRIAYLDQAPLAPFNRTATYGAPYAAHAAAMRAAGLRPHRLEAARPHPEDGYNATRTLLAASPAPDAVLCRTDDLALGASRAIREAGLLPGRDILLVGCNGMEELAYLSPSLSTLAFPVERMASEAWAMLRARIAGDARAAPRTLTLPVPLVSRESTAGR